MEHGLARGLHVAAVLSSFLSSLSRRKAEATRPLFYCFVAILLPLLHGPVANLLRVGRP
jgi:hypothetical protein